MNDHPAVSATSPASPPPVLALVGADFGELSNTWQLLEGTSVRARMLVAPALYAHDPVFPGLVVEPLRSREQVLDAIRAERPRVLLLMSGYFFVAQQLLTRADLEAIMQAARDIGARVVTSDPLIGYVAHVAAAAAVRALFADAVHVHLAPAPAGPLHWACHNPRLTLAPSQRATLAGGLAEIGVMPGVPFWLFVLSGADHRLQCRLQGRSRLDATLQAWGRQARAAGCQPVFLVPPLACESLAGESSGSALVLPFCDHRRFQALLLHAQHAFFWNLLSNSILARVTNGGSVFFLDDGHLAHFVPALLPLAHECYYQNAPLPRLDPAKPLDSQALAQAASQQVATFAPALQALRALPTPDQWFARVLEGAGT